MVLCVLLIVNDCGVKVRNFGGYWHADNADFQTLIKTDFQIRYHPNLPTKESVPIRDVITVTELRRLSKAEVPFYRSPVSSSELRNEVEKFVSRTDGNHKI